MNKKIIIIVGIILLLIVGIGVFLYLNNYNKEFERFGVQPDGWDYDNSNTIIMGYEGIHTGTSIRHLIDFIIDLNQRNEKEHPEKIVYLNEVKDVKGLNQIKENINNNKVYDVELGLENGYINKVIVTEKTGWSYLN